MTEQELRGKIIKALKRGGNMFHEYFMRSLNDAKESGKTHFGSKDCDKSMYDFFADALIEEGLKFDVKYSFTAAFNSLQEEREKELERRLAKAEHRAEVAEKALSKVFTKTFPWCCAKVREDIVNECLQESEKELQEAKHDKE